jgi:hypothetical protein
MMSEPVNPVAAHYLPSRHAMALIRIKWPHDHAAPARCFHCDDTAPMSDGFGSAVSRIAPSRCRAAHVTTRRRSTVPSAEDFRKTSSTRHAAAKEGVQIWRVGRDRRESGGGLDERTSRDAERSRVTTRRASVLSPVRRSHVRIHGRRIRQPEPRAPSMVVRGLRPRILNLGPTFVPPPRPVVRPSAA